MTEQPELAYEGEGAGRSPRVDAKPTFIGKYSVLMKAEWAVLLAYRSETVIWMLGAFIQPMVSLAVWLSISGAQGEIAGYSAYDYVRYFIGVLLVERLTRSWDVWDVDRDIREGTYSAKLLRPFHPVHWSLCSNLVYKFFFASLLIPAWLILSIPFPVLRFPVEWIAGLAAIWAIAVSAAMTFVIGYEFGLLAFWSNRATAIYSLYEMTHLFLAGRIAPLSMFPDWIAVAAKWLPFYYTVGLPVDLLTGKMNGQTMLIGQNLAVQAAWLLIFMTVFRIMWRAGLKKYGAAGG